MKKLAVFIFCLSFGIAVNAATISAPINKGQGYQSVYLLNESISAHSYTEKTFYQIGGFNSLSCKVYSVSAGSIPTASARWEVPNAGGVLTVASSYFKTDGTQFSDFLADNVTIRIYNAQGSTVRVTGNIVLRNSNQTQQKSVRSIISATVLTSAATTLNITAQTQGYLYLKTNKRVFINLLGTAASASDLYVNDDESVDFTPIFLKAGDKVSILAASSTATVSGFIYE